jgi:PBP1b-binding outer membrane lipoprotein LpoB
MKKSIVLLAFLALAIVSCKQKTKNEINVSYQPETKNEIKYDFLQIFNSKELLDLNKKNAEPK